MYWKVYNISNLIIFQQKYQKLKAFTEEVWSSDFLLICVHMQELLSNNIKIPKSIQDLFVAIETQAAGVYVVLVCLSVCDYWDWKRLNKIKHASTSKYRYETQLNHAFSW